MRVRRVRFGTQAAYVLERRRWRLKLARSGMQGANWRETSTSDNGVTGDSNATNSCGGQALTEQYPVESPPERGDELDFQRDSSHSMYSRVEVEYKAQST